jgi:hypothetical protein
MMRLTRTDLKLVYVYAWIMYAIPQPYTTLRICCPVVRHRRQTFARCPPHVKEQRKKEKHLQENLPQKCLDEDSHVIGSTCWSMFCYQEGVKVTYLYRDRGQARQC